MTGWLAVWQLPSDLNELRETWRTEEAKAEALVADGSAVREYERVVQQIKLMEARFEQEKAKRAGRDGRIAELEQQWCARSAADAAPRRRPHG